MAAAALRQISELPGPRGLPILGNVLQVKVSRIHQDVERWARQYGPFFQVRFGPTLILVVADHEALGLVLRDRPDGFARSPETVVIGKEMGLPGPGLFGAEGDNWRHQRRMVMASFSPQQVKAYFPTLLKVTRRLHGRWQKAARAQAPIDLQDDLMRYTVDTIAGLAFGADINTLESDADVIQQHLDKIFPALFKRILTLFRHWRYFKLPSDRALDRSVAAIRQAIDDFIAKARTDLRNDPARRDHPGNLLEAMLVAADQPDSHVDDAAVAGNVLTMLLAGEDTTANTLAWMIHLLHLNPAALQKAQSEVRSALGSELPASLDQIDRLTYLDACVQETLRLKPVAPFMGLIAKRDSTVADIHVPAGTRLWCVMRHDSVAANHFPNPTAFEPERWLASEAHDSAPKRVAMPFGAGARVCPGRYLAMLEIKLAMVMLLGRFEITAVTTPDGLPAREHMAFAMGPVGLTMTVREAA